LKTIYLACLLISLSSLSLYSYDYYDRPILITTFNKISFALVNYVPQNINAENKNMSRGAIVSPLLILISIINNIIIIIIIIIITINHITITNIIIIIIFIALSNLIPKSEEMKANVRRNGY